MSPADSITALIAALSTLARHRAALGRAHRPAPRAGRCRPSRSQLAEAILQARERVQFCATCGALTEKFPCDICADPRREFRWCVSWNGRWTFSASRSPGTFRGKYHVLGGKISPLDGVEPDDLRIAELEKRLARSRSRKSSSRWARTWKATRRAFISPNGSRGGAEDHPHRPRPARRHRPGIRRRTDPEPRAGRPTGNVVNGHALNRSTISPMPAAQIVVFDLGKVLVDFDYSIAARKIVARCTRPVDHGRFFDDHSPLLVRYEFGLATTRGFVRGNPGRERFRRHLRRVRRILCRYLHRDPGNDRSSRRPPAPGLSDLHFFDTNHLAVTHIRRRFPFFSQFDGYIYSYKHGAIR